MFYIAEMTDTINGHEYKMAITRDGKWGIGLDYDADTHMPIVPCEALFTSKADANWAIDRYMEELIIALPEVNFDSVKTEVIASPVKLYKATFTRQKNRRYENLEMYVEAPDKETAKRKVFALTYNLDYKPDRFYPFYLHLAQTKDFDRFTRLNKIESAKEA